jgi:AcrR family transcriptional regulator
MLTAALTLAAHGGFDGVQMRDVAEQAEVALGTLYRYFPSKVHLLAETLAERMEALRLQVTAGLPDGTPADRAMGALRALLDEMQRSPRASEALVRSMMVADGSARAEVERVNQIAMQIINEAAYGPEYQPDARDDVVAQVVGKVLMTDLLGWASERMTVAEVERSLQHAVTVAFAGRDALVL